MENLKIADLDMEKSFFCGDAAGRKNDHTNDDIMFSVNIGLKFCTPEMFFENKEIYFEMVKGAKIYQKYKVEDGMKENVGSGEVAKPKYISKKKQKYTTDPKSEALIAELLKQDRQQVAQR